MIGDAIICCKQDLPDEEHIKKQAEYFKALSDPARVKIVYALAGGERCVCELMAIMDMQQTVVSHHLKVLKYAGIISDKKSGKWVYYSLVDKKTVELLSILKAEK
ncbi:ArsR family transcriptional regulator [Methanocella sp. CWC-04]|uniref:ArsR family transcriptional regulator n=2 Tax=Methanooceanicella nereidis TaxID=2052831 RepID=A0AAP2RBP2_9EURY|nr:ArsR family transcriptional regulator [Methanocella sp. CWC-04]